MSWNQQSWDNLTGMFWNEYDLYTWGDLYVSDFWVKLGVAALSFRQANRDQIVYNDYRVLSLLEEIEQLKTREKNLRLQNKLSEANKLKQHRENLEIDLGGLIHLLIYES